MIISACKLGGLGRRGSDRPGRDAAAAGPGRRGYAISEPESQSIGGTVPSVTRRDRPDTRVTGFPAAGPGPGPQSATESANTQAGKLPGELEREISQ